MTTYLFSVQLIDGAPPPAPDVTEKMFKDVDALNDELKKEGRWVFAGGLHPVSSATVVTVKNGEVLTTDGPFSEAKEHIGGFWILRADDLDDALKVAERASRACGAPVEVRPFEGEVEG